MKAKTARKTSAQRGASLVGSSAWLVGNPPDHGYYLASWGTGENRTVSELWYNPTNGWWTSRGYLQAYDGMRNWGHRPVPHVYAWMPMPAPAPQANIKGSDTLAMNHPLQPLVEKTPEQRDAGERCSVAVGSAWTSVADKMPPIGADVLTWGRVLPGYGPDVRRVYRGPNNAPDFGDGWRPGQTFEVTHWAFISSPNKPDEERPAGRNS